MEIELNKVPIGTVVKHNGHSYVKASNVVNGMVMVLVADYLGTIRGHTFMGGYIYVEMTDDVVMVLPREVFSGVEELETCKKTVVR